MAAGFDGVFQIDNQFDRLSITSEGSSKLSVDTDNSKYDDEFTRKWGFRLKELYRLALKFYRGKGAYISLIISYIFLSYQAN